MNRRHSTKEGTWYSRKKTQQEHQDIYTGKILLKLKDKTDLWSDPVGVSKENSRAKKEQKEVGKYTLQLRDEFKEPRERFHSTDTEVDMGLTHEQAEKVDCDAIDSQTFTYDHCLQAMLELPVTPRTKNTKIINSNGNIGKIVLQRRERQKQKCFVKEMEDNHDELPIYARRGRNVTSLKILTSPTKTPVRGQFSPYNLRPSPHVRRVTAASPFNGSSPSWLLVKDVAEFALKTPDSPLNGARDSSDESFHF